MEDRHNHNITDIATFLATTVMTRERVAKVTAGGDRNAFQTRPWGEVYLLRTLTIPMRAVGPSGLDLATAALGPLQPPSVGQDWEHMRPISAIPADTPLTYTLAYTSTFDGYYGLFTGVLPANGYGLDMRELPVNYTMLLVLMGEGEITGTDVRRLSMLPYIIPRAQLPRGHYS